MNKITAFIVVACVIGFCAYAANKPEEITAEQLARAQTRLQYIQTREGEILREIARLEIEKEQQERIIIAFKAQEEKKVKKEGKE